MVNRRRVSRLNRVSAGRGPVVYWMSRDQRAEDNWALLFAGELARERGQALHVVFCLVPGFHGAAMRQYGFMLAGLEELEEKLRGMNISFRLLSGSPPRAVAAAAGELGAGAVVADFAPLRLQAGWRKEAAGLLRCAFFEVDAHNIVPCRAASWKQEYAAYTIRPKIEKELDEFLEEFPRTGRHPFGGTDSPAVDWGGVKRTLAADAGVPEVGWIEPGERAARRALSVFVRSGLECYAKNRNNPAADGQSNLSPYFHFGQLAPQRAALEAERSGADPESVHAFLEELIIRRELAENFCFYNPRYDSPDSFPDWARASLDKHSPDPREAVFTLGQFESARTGDELWDAAQTQMLRTGKMHGYMRMYWAKKILEWTETPREAVETAVYLNDRYELDGRDPNGYAGIMWSIGGVHDRAWPERPVFGKVRYMSRSGAKKKFDVDAYVSKARSAG